MDMFAVASVGEDGYVQITATRRQATPFNVNADYGKALVVETPSSSAAVEALESILRAGWLALLDVTDRSALGRALGTVSDGSNRRYVPFRPHRRRSAEVLLRVRDIVVAMPALVVAVPVIAVAALLIRMTEAKGAGPIFHRATVVGQNGAPFVWRKLRTMRPPAAADDSVRAERFRAFIDGANAGGAHMKIVDEARVTRVGRFLRKHSVDELPQLWNVLAGDMTLVGPRPLLDYEYSLQLPWHRLRFSVRPGLTGIWQVYGRSRVPFDDMALMDYCYTHHRSFGLDLRLLAATILVVLTGRGGV